MRHCTQCGANLPTNAQFCGRCGTTSEASVKQELSQKDVSTLSQQSSRSAEPGPAAQNNSTSRPSSSSSEGQRVEGTSSASLRPASGGGIPRRPQGNAQSKLDAVSPQQLRTSFEPPAASFPRPSEIAASFANSELETLERTETPPEVITFPREQRQEDKPLPPHLARLSSEDGLGGQRQTGMSGSSARHPAVGQPLPPHLARLSSGGASGAQKESEMSTSSARHPAVGQPSPVVRPDTRKEPTGQEPSKAFAEPHPTPRSHPAVNQVVPPHLSRLDLDTNPSLTRIARVEPVSGPLQRSVLPKPQPEERKAQVSEVALPATGEQGQRAEKPLSKSGIPVRPTNRSTTTPGERRVIAKEEEKGPERPVPRSAIPARPGGRLVSSPKEREIAEKLVEGKHVVERSAQRPEVAEPFGGSEPVSGEQVKLQRRIMPSTEERKHVVERSAQRPETAEPIDGSEPVSGGQANVEEQDMLRKQEAEEGPLQEPVMTTETLSEAASVTGEQGTAEEQSLPLAELGGRAAENSLPEPETVADVPDKRVPSSGEQGALVVKELSSPEDEEVAVAEPFRDQEANMTSINEPSPPGGERGPFERNGPPFQGRREFPGNKPLWAQETRMTPASGPGQPPGEQPGKGTSPGETPGGPTHNMPRPRDSGDVSARRTPPFPGWGVSTNRPLWEQETRMTPTSGPPLSQQERIMQTPLPETGPGTPGERSGPGGPGAAFDRKTPLPRENGAPNPPDRGAPPRPSAGQPGAAPSDGASQPEAAPKAHIQNKRVWSEDTWDIGVKNRFTPLPQQATSRTGQTIRFILALFIALLVLGGLGFFISVQENSSGSSAGSGVYNTIPGGSQGLGTVTTNGAITPTATSVTSAALMTFTGSLNGPFVASAVESCGVSNGLYDFGVMGTIAGAGYRLDIEVENYHGPGTYSDRSANPASGLGLVFIANANSSINRWESFGQVGSITVNKDEKSGSITAKVFNATRTTQIAQVVGTWNCP